MQLKKAYRILLSCAAIAACPLILTQCATGGDPVGDGLEDIGDSIEENLPGLGPNPTDADDPFTR